MNKLEGFPTINCISLEESVNRRESLSFQFEKYGLIPNYLLSKRWEKDKDIVFGASSLHSASEKGIACTVSHLKMIKKWYDTTDEEYGFFCEDDLSLETIPYWDFAFHDFIQQLPSDWEALQLCIIRDFLGVANQDQWKPENTYLDILRDRDIWDWSATAYILTRKYAKKLIDQYIFQLKDILYNLPPCCGEATAYKLEVVYWPEITPMVEHILFLNTGKVYACPLFVENINGPTTYSNEQYPNHIYSANFVLDWWKNKYNKYTKHIEVLKQFCLDTENPENNYQLAEWYRKQNHLSPASIYYLRASERTKDNNLAYKYLLNLAECYHKLAGNRETTRRHILENAVTLLPERPEAYLYLCFYYELKKDWTNCYKHACIGLYQCSKVDLNLFSEFDQDWEALLLYMKAVSSWWCGRGMESRKLFRMLAFNYWDRLSKEYQISVENNFMRLGAGTSSQDIKLYTKNNFDKLRYKFRDAEKIEKNYSQVFQDMFVLSMLDGKKDGTFLEIGGSKPFENNNTALLEQEFGWGGVSIEWNESFVQEYKQNRPTTKILCSNALEIDYELLLLENYKGNIIDYLQLDIEPLKNTYECLLKIPFDKYQFRVITYEHDHYADITQTYREKSRKYLLDNGYKLIANDISLDGKSAFEDWWVHPDLVDQNIIEKMISITEYTKKADYYMLSNDYYAAYETDKYIR